MWEKIVQHGEALDKSGEKAGKTREEIGERTGNLVD